MSHQTDFKGVSPGHVGDRAVLCDILFWFYSCLIVCCHRVGVTEVTQTSGQYDG